MSYAIWPKNEEELIFYLRELSKEPDWSKPNEAYNNVAHAIAKAALAAFRYMSHVHGCSLAQAGWARDKFLEEVF